MKPVEYLQSACCQQCRLLEGPPLQIVFNDAGAAGLPWRCCYVGLEQGEGLVNFCCWPAIQDVTREPQPHETCQGREGLLASFQSDGI